MNRIRLILITCIFLICGCTQSSSSETPPPQPSSFPDLITTTQQPINTAMPSLTASPTSENTDTPTSTVTSTIEPTIRPEAKLSIDCIDVDDNLSPDLEMNGSLVLSGGYQNYFIWNLRSGEQIPLSINAYLDFAPSPDGRLLAYTDLENEGGWIRIVDSSGQLTQSFPLEERWSGVIGWLDDEHLSIMREAEPLYSTIILDLVSGQSEEYLNDYPGAFYYDVPYFYWGQNAYTAASYSPDLERVVYLGLISDSPNVGYVIWDIKAEKIIAEIDTPGNSAFNQPPIWSASGDGFIVAYSEREIKLIGYIPDDELYSITGEGEMTKLTNLSAHFTIGVDIRQYNPSPDGRHIAFWAAGNPPPDLNDRKLELAVLDMETEKVTMYCLEGDFRNGGLPPIWAPSSDQLVVKGLAENGKVRIVIVDINKSVAAAISQDLDLYGWMVTSP